MKPVINVEGLGKLYRLGEVGTGTLSHDLKRWWAVTRGKDDPFKKIGSVNDRTKKAQDSEYVWALSDINFQVLQGDVVGVIGKNGAGKSTLLKILSRITAPSVGNVKLKGRIGSLLEVGTGFHPEMTGRENVFMNGTILGMRRAEITRQFDDIVDFAGVSKYIDTPVKRYSSGMMVRLGFAVAAFLEPEILIVDEVLAVGDAEFQKKALGKLQNVSKTQGRTVLFVSHNISAIAELCTKGVLLKNGQLNFSGNIGETIERYISINDLNTDRFRATNSKETFIEEAFVFSDDLVPRINFSVKEQIKLKIRVNTAVAMSQVKIGIALLDRLGKKIFSDFTEISAIRSGSSDFVVTLPENLLLPASYSFDISVFKSPTLIYDYVKEVCSFTLEDTGYNMSSYSSRSDIGIIRANCEWQEL
jgi:lipopolysaccharide transport system ATP-binding protein